jgi:CRISPR-associated protein Cas1
MTTQVRHPLFGYTVSYRRAVELQARILAVYLIGELPQYEPLVTR